MVGEAVGKSQGFALNWRYQLDLALPDGEVVRVNFDDWMYLLDEDRMINRAAISKFGIDLGGGDPLYRAKIMTGLHCMKANKKARHQRAFVYRKIRVIR